MQRKGAGEFYRTTLVGVDSYEQGVPAGRLYNPGFGGSCMFQSLTQMLTEMEHILDKTALPQSYTVVRSFTRNAEPVRTVQTEEQFQPGQWATFSIRVLFRQNASWQGSVKWLEGGMEESFRSALELIFLMDSVLSERKSEKAG